MASINEKELIRIINSGDISGVYYLYGTDSYSVEKYCRLLREKTVDKDGEAYNLHRFEGKDFDVEEAAAVCENYPVFAPKLCVTVRDLDLETETKSRPGHKAITAERMKLLTNTVSDLPETTVLIFYTQDIDICGGKKVPTAKNKKLVDLVDKHGTVCVLNIKTRAESARLIASAFSERGCTVDNRAAEMIYDRCGGDMNMIMNETDKLSAYKPGGHITAEDVSMLTPDISDAKAYNLADAAASGNVSLAMKLYNELLSDPDTSPVYLLYTLAGSMNDLYRARLAIDSGRGISDVMQDFGYARNLEFRIKNAFGSARRSDTPRLRRCMRILGRADTDMKSGAGDPAVILEKAIVEMLKR